MPRYFFDLEDHVIDLDDEGQLLASTEAARVEAVIFAGAYLRDDPGLLDDGQRFVVSVREETDGAIFKIVVQCEPTG